MDVGIRFFFQTARVYWTRLQMDILDEINELRQSPETYAFKLERMVSYYQGDVVKVRALVFFSKFTLFGPSKSSCSGR